MLMAANNLPYFSTASLRILILFNHLALLYKYFSILLTQKLFKDVITMTAWNSIISM